MSEIIIDFERRLRCAVEEAIFCASKSPAQIEKIISMGEQQQTALLFTRLEEDKYSLLSPRSQHQLDYCAISQTAVLGSNEKPAVDSNSTIAIVSGGSSDTAVCHEVLRTLNYHDVGANLYEDVGVSALWRLTNILDELNQAKVIIAVAGMEAALPTVLSGLISKPIIAVPTSVGYGVSANGQLALNACLGSCAAGLVTVNIDNGFGAACAAIKMVNSFSS
ncbi:MAG: nickel pincer cofactor biosynthesis protein LarB [Photobacterium frigidiphilum]|uniref:nickel pincer cofactor biosynthesis protein LarB n=1 Tax=Photobacterium frigidiphilum TaxID=264736 RepID=UPI0030014C33